MSWTKDKIAALLKSNDRAVEKAMVSLYDRQTQDEKRDSSTRHDNKRGFRANHASKGSYYARWVLGGRRLTGHHLANARSIALHYTQQLVDEANAKETAKTRKIDADEDKREAYKSFLADSDPQAEFNFARPRRCPDGCCGEAEDHELRMQRAEAEADRAQTQREEAAKFNARMRMEETRCLRPFNLPCFCTTCTSVIK